MNANNQESLPTTPCPECGRMERNKFGYLLCACSTKYGEIFQRQWAVKAAGFHPFWDNYLITLYDITTVLPGEPAAEIVKEGMTHEFFIWAFDPKWQGPPLTYGAINKKTWIQHGWFKGALHPANHGYQFKAESNTAAETRIQRMHDRVKSGMLNPDSDAREIWDKLFEDGEPRVKHKGFDELMRDIRKARNTDAN